MISQTSLPAPANLRKAADRLKERNPDPASIEKPISDLEKIFEKIKNTAPKAAHGNAGTMKELDTFVLVKKAMDDLNRLPVQVILYRS